MALTKVTNSMISGGAVNVLDFGAVGDGSDDTAAIQAALDTGLTVEFPGGVTYNANNLTMSTDYQTLLFSGRCVLQKNANGPLLTVSGNRCSMYRARFDGASASYTGHNIVKSGVHLLLVGCSSYDAAGRAVLDSDGNGLKIIGTNHIYQTTDTSATGYDIEIGGTGLYSMLTNIYSSQATGGVYIHGAGSVMIQGCQFGKLLWDGGFGGYISNCRLNGVINIETGSVALNNFSASADMTIGDSSGGFSNIVVGEGVALISGATFTVTSGVQNSAFHNLSVLRNNGVTVDISSAGVNNDFYDDRISYTPTWTGGGTPPAIGNGSLSAYYTRQGRRVIYSLSLQAGSTTTFGSGGAWTFTLPVAASAVLARQIGSCLSDDVGTGFDVGASQVSASGTTVAVIANSGGAVTNTVPHAWAATDRFSFEIEYEV